MNRTVNILTIKGRLWTFARFLMKAIKNQTTNIHLNKEIIGPVIIKLNVS